MKKNSISSIIILFITAIIWGFAFAFQRIGGGSLGTYWFNGIRFLIGAVSLVPVVLIFERAEEEKEKIKNTVLYGAICGTVLFAASTLQQIGIMWMPENESAGKSAFITGLYMVLVPFCGIFMGKKVRREAFLGAAVALIGLYFVSFKGAG